MRKLLLVECLACGHDNRALAKFCEECGAPLARVCPKCREEVPPEHGPAMHAGTCWRGAAAAAQPPPPTSRQDTAPPSGRGRAPDGDQLGPLGLVLNAIVLWNTRYMNKALDQLRSEGFAVREEDVARLLAFLYKHIHMLARYHFRLTKRVRGGRLRPLRDPSLSRDDVD